MHSLCFVFYKGHVMSVSLRLQTLQSHYCPEVSLLASQLLESVDRKSEENIRKYLDRDIEEVNPFLSSSISLVPCVISSPDDVECSNQAVR